MLTFNLIYLLKCFPHRFRKFLTSQFTLDPTNLKKQMKNLLILGRIIMLNLLD